MKKINLLTLSILVLSGCRFGNPSFSSTSSFTSSIPIPNDDFNPDVNGRTILIEHIQERQFTQTTSSTLSPLPLAEINFQHQEEVTPPYAVADALVGDFSNQTLTFSNEDIDITSTLNQLEIGESLSSDATLDFLNTIQPTDERFNAKTIDTKIRNLSHVYFQSDYFWYNNYVLEEQMVVNRYDNQVLYGTGNQLKTFQTEVDISVAIAYQLYADATTIYEIRDETYPSGFFGASDDKYQAIRTSDNFKQALTMGPITDILGLRKQWIEQGEMVGFPMSQSQETYASSLEVRKTQADTLSITFAIFQGETLNASDETLTVSVTIQNQTSSALRLHYQLWQPSML